MTEEELKRKLAELDREAEDTRRLMTQKAARLQDLRLERKQLLADNPAPRTLRQDQYAAAMARKERRDAKTV